MRSLTMTYFHGRPSTIIGAKAFHGPVRDGKGWFHLAMVVKRVKRWGRRARRRPGDSEAAHSRCGACGVGHTVRAKTGATPQVVLQGTAIRYNPQGYRIKPHGPLVLV